MQLLPTMAVAVGLGMDAMSVAMGLGVRWHGPRQKFRLAWHAGVFQFLMPIAGWAAGQEVAGLLSRAGTYVAAAMVFAIGVKMLYEALRAQPGSLAQREERAVEKALHAPPKDPTRGGSLLALSVATSLDALVVGFSLGLRGREIWVSSVLIGVVAGLMSLAGVVIGQHAGRYFGRWAEVGGAAILMALGVSFLWI